MTSLFPQSPRTRTIASAPGAFALLALLSSGCGGHQGGQDGPRDDGPDTGDASALPLVRNVSMSELAEQIAPGFSGTGGPAESVKLLANFKARFQETERWRNPRARYLDIDFKAPAGESLAVGSTCEPLKNPWSVDLAQDVPFETIANGTEGAETIWTQSSGTSLLITTREERPSDVPGSGPDTTTCATLYDGSSDTFERRCVTYRGFASEVEVIAAQVSMKEGAQSSTVQSVWVNDQVSGSWRRMSAAYRQTGSATQNFAASNTVGKAVVENAVFRGAAYYGFAAAKLDLNWTQVPRDAGALGEGDVFDCKVTAVEDLVE